jgi:hypothetical protein
MLAAAQAAKDKFTQHILTKAMYIQIWKPEFERAGRHFVYASRYLRFIVQLLEQLGERATIEQLGKRVRKKQNEFIDLPGIFEEICSAHMRLLRKQENIPEGSEERIFKMNIPFEEFTLNANRLETWAHSQLSLTDKKLPLLSEVFELKKLNGTLLDKGPFEELMNDIYACLYQSVVPGLVARAGEAQNREKMRIDRMLLDSNTENTTPTPAGETTNAPSRAKTISKTEVRKRSEALLAKPAVTTGKSKVATTTESNNHNVPVKTDINKRSVSKDVEEASIHDSADAESELSSLDEDIEEPEEVKSSPLAKKVPVSTLKGNQSSDEEEEGDDDEKMDTT